MKHEDRLVAMAETNGWLVAEIARLRYEFWGLLAPDDIRAEMSLPRTVREGIQMLIGEEWDVLAEQYLSKPPHRELCYNPNDMPPGVK